MQVFGGTMMWRVWRVTGEKIAGNSLAPHTNIINNIVCFAFYQWPLFLTTPFILYLLLSLLLLKALFIFVHALPHVLALFPNSLPNYDAKPPSSRGCWRSSTPFCSLTALPPLSISTRKHLSSLSVFWPPLLFLSSLALRFFISVPSLLGFSYFS